MVVLAGLLSLTQAALGGDLSEWPGGDCEWEACHALHNFCLGQLRAIGPATHPASWNASVVENIVATGPMSGAIHADEGGQVIHGEMVTLFRKAVNPSLLMGVPGAKVSIRCQERCLVVSGLCFIANW